MTEEENYDRYYWFAGGNFIGAYKGLAALPLSLLAALVVILSNGMPVWESYASYYMGGYAGTYSSYLLIFIFSALYAKFMDSFGCATAVGYKLIDWFGKKNVILVSVLITSVLTYGGVSLFVCIFVVGPIMFLLFKEANLPRHLTVACLVIGSSTYTMTSIPGTPALTNIIPTKFLGTKMTAAPVLGILCSIAMFVMCMVYARLQEKKAIAAGEGWTYPAHMNTGAYEIADRSTLPAAWKSFLPMIVLILFIIIGGRFISDSALLTVAAMLSGTILVVLFNLDRLKGKSIKQLLGVGLNDGISAIGGLAAVVSFGTVVQNSAAFQVVVDWVLSIKMHPYLEGIFSTAVISGITGSPSGGLRLTLQILGENFIASGCDLEVLHRLISVAAGSLDTLPHAAGLFLVLSYLGLSHKEGYKHVFWTSVAIPAITVLVAAGACILLGI